jgi:hypothetical protein
MRVCLEAEKDTWGYKGGGGKDRSCVAAAKQSLEPPEAERGRDRFFHSLHRERHPTKTWILNFWPPEL